MNNRPFKFRVWSKTKKNWLNSIVIGDTGIPFIFYVEVNDKQEVINKVFTLDGFDPIIQQYTGLKDKNGKEIYEGDIVYVYDPANKFVVKFGKVIRNVVSYDEKSTNKLEFNTFHFEATDNKKAYQSITENECGEHDLNGTVIIGNIFENPELKIKI